MTCLHGESRFINALGTANCQVKQEFFILLEDNTLAVNRTKIDQAIAEHFENYTLCQGYDINSNTDNGGQRVFKVFMVLMLIFLKSTDFYTAYGLENDTLGAQNCDLINGSWSNSCLTDINNYLTGLGTPPPAIHIKWQSVYYPTLDISNGTLQLMRSAVLLH